MTAEQVVKNEFGEEVSHVLLMPLSPVISCSPSSYYLISPPAFLLSSFILSLFCSLCVLQVLLSFGDEPQARHNVDGNTAAAIKVCFPAHMYGSQ